MLRFGPLPAGFVMDRLTKAGMDRDEAAFWAAYTGGSIGRSLELSAAGLYETKRDLLAKVAVLPPAGDADLADELAKLTERLAATAVKAVKEKDGAALSEALAKRTAAGAMLELLASMYRDALHLRIAGFGIRDSGLGENQTRRSGDAETRRNGDAQADLLAPGESPLGTTPGGRPTLASGGSTDVHRETPGRPLIHADQRECIDALARRFDHEQLAAIIEHLSDFETMLWQNVNAKLVWHNAVISCASAAPL
jgi:hypothetical protein